MMQQRNGATSDYPGAFERVSGVLPGQRAAWLGEARRAAIRRFAECGFPTREHGDWKYTSVAALADFRFNVLPAPCPTYLADQVRVHALPGAHLLVFVNGQLEPELCRPARLPPGVVVHGLAYTLDRYPQELEASMGEVTMSNGGVPSTPFADLNLAFMTDGAWIRLPPGVAVATPIQLLFIAGEGSPAIQPRNVIDAGAGSSATIVEQHVAATDQPYFTNAVTDISLAANAEITHCKLQQEGREAFHIAAVNAEQGAKSTFRSVSMAAGARLARVDIAATLEAEGAICELDGLYLADGHQLVDHHTRIDHRRPDGASRQLYKGILGGVARAVFDGRLTVGPEARDCEAAQSSHHLLLSEHAEVDATPQLEIRADRVKCAHAATVGQLPEGLERNAQIHEFAGEILARLPVLPLRQRVERLLNRRFGPNHFNA